MRPSQTAVLTELPASGAARSAQKILPVVFDLIQPHRVVELGCQDDAWLRVCRELGATDVLGVGGSDMTWEASKLPGACLVSHDLKRPLEIGRTFDLAVSHGFAEHLPAAYADQFLDGLTRLAPVILFSAAVPGQEARHHLNEQWPDYWAERFAQRGYLASDLVRRAVWRDQEVDPRDAQNTLLYVRSDLVRASEALHAAVDRTDLARLSVVHPRIFRDRANARLRSLYELVPATLHAALRAGQQQVLPRAHLSLENARARVGRWGRRAVAPTQGGRTLHHPAPPPPLGSEQYGVRFYQDRWSGSRRSAQSILPLVFERVHPSSVVDVGCGVGTWLRVCRELGVADVFGIDGPYVLAEQLEIPSTRFLAHDLTRPLQLGRTFDLAISVEVAEHLPGEYADQFVDALTGLAPLVLFSAAIPGQGGSHHVNEQWPDYWAERFERRGYLSIDLVRPAVWRNPRVDPWYAQNTILYARTDVVAGSDLLRTAAAETDRAQLAMVHPRMFGLRDRSVCELGPATLEVACRMARQQVQQVGGLDG